MNALKRMISYIGLKSGVPNLGVEDFQKNHCPNQERSTIRKTNAFASVGTQREVWDISAQFPLFINKSLSVPTNLPLFPFLLSFERNPHPAS